MTPLLAMLLVLVLAHGVGGDNARGSSSGSNDNLNVHVNTVGGGTKASGAPYHGVDTFWEYNHDKQVWESVTTESMQYRLSKMDQELILASRLNATEAACSSVWPNRNALGQPINSTSGVVYAGGADYGLSVLWSKSVFCVSSEGAVFERFFNEQLWVYVNHHSRLFSAASITAYAGRLYVSARDGSVWERRRVGQELKWINANVPVPHKVASPPRMDPDGALWFVSDSGHLLQCDRKVSRSKVCQNWVDHLKPFGKCLAAVADASTFQPGAVFVVSDDGQLLQYDVGLQEWADLGRPVWAGVGPTEAVAVVNDQTGDRSMFLLSTQGTLVELFYRANASGTGQIGPGDPSGTSTSASGDGAEAAARLVASKNGGGSAEATAVSHTGDGGGSGGGGGDGGVATDGGSGGAGVADGSGSGSGDGGEASGVGGASASGGGGGGGDENNGDDEGHWEWFDHGSPVGDRIIGPPGGLINLRSLFMVSENGTVYERYWDGSRWIWVSHGHSGTPMLPARPVAQDNRHIFFLREDGLLTERFWNGIEWVWSIHRVPNPGGAADGGGSSTTGSNGGNNGGGLEGTEAVSFCSPEIGVRNSCAPPEFNKNSKALPSGPSGPSSSSGSGSGGGASNVAA